MNMENKNFEIAEKADCSDQKVLSQKVQEIAGTKMESSDKGFGSADGFSVYMRRLSHYPVTSAEEQLEMARRYQDKGDQDAACMLVYSNLRLVVKIAMKYQRKWMNNNLDLIQEGNVGLMKALQKFDTQRGVTFSYYASFWIKAYILKYIMDNWRIVKVGTSHAQRSLFYNLSREEQRLESQGVKPDSETISKILDVSESDVVEMGQIMGSHDLSLDMPYKGDSDVAPKDILPTTDEGVENTYLQKETAVFLREKIREMLPELNYREKDIIRLRLMADSPLSLRKIGEKYHITRERVRQIESKLLGKIKGHIQDDRDDFSAEWIGGV
ncbi:sigma-70 family RNA polymerase sigma factor [Desulfonatronovibrio magnus]|uniref:sigma-70 family RNA polymerase sigma factor n=1 Tax=Desulfonatronovibrio magnus TaxID=698827 RepID=UPI0005EB01CB|nr:RNA polymerase factor sigma-32 [Desulfonatronovibrio magnus]